jgi:hypothetical protein
MEVPGGAGLPPGTGPRIPVGLFLPRGTARTRKWIMRRTQRKHFVTFSRELIRRDKNGMVR